MVFFLISKILNFHTLNIYKKCNIGCQKEFKPKEDSGCIHHPGEPVFSNLKKYWTCCNVRINIKS